VFGGRLGGLVVVPGPCSGLVGGGGVIAWRVWEFQNFRIFFL
jgi:hypothetical protein